MTLKLLTFGFVLLSVALAFWLLVSWYVFSGAKFDCADRTGDLNACVSTIYWRVGIQSAIPIAVWCFVGSLLMGAWKKD